MRIVSFQNKLTKGLKRSSFFYFLKSFTNGWLFIILSLSITFNNYAQDDDSDFLDKVLEEKPKKAEQKKVDSKKVATATTPTNTKTKKKKSSKSSKKVTKKNTTSTESKPVNSNSDNNKSSSSNLPQIANSKLNLDFWIHEEFAVNYTNIPGYEENNTKVVTNPNIPNTNINKPSDKKVIEKPLEKDTKSNPIIAFLNEYKKIIFIFAAIIIFAFYRLRYAGARNYNNSGRIFSKFRNK